MTITQVGHNSGSLTITSLFNKCSSKKAIVSDSNLNQVVISLDEDCTSGKDSSSLKENDKCEQTAPDLCTTQVISFDKNCNAEKDSGSQKENDQREPTAANVSTTQVNYLDEDCSVGNDEASAKKEKMVIIIF